jgi:hypothetical protein
MADMVRYMILHSESVSPREGMAAFRKRRASVFPQGPFR